MKYKIIGAIVLVFVVVCLGVYKVRSPADSGQSSSVIDGGGSQPLLPSIQDKSAPNAGVTNTPTPAQSTSGNNALVEAELKKQDEISGRAQKPLVPSKFSKFD